MKSPKLANKFWSWVVTVAVILLFGVSPFVVAAFTPSTPTAAAVTYAAPSYAFSNNWYEELGVVDYNNYLQKLQSTSGLKTVTVAIIDSGLDYTSSPVFNGRVNKQYACNFNLSNNRTAQDWYQDESGHGTHVAGIIAAGSMANVQLLPIRIFNGSDNSMAYSMFQNAVDYVCKLAKTLNIVAVNLSLGTVGITEDQNDFLVKWVSNLGSYQPYINKLRNAGILPVVAAGNIDSKLGETDTKSYYAFPAACEGVVAVGAYYRDSYGVARRASFSYYNERVTISAPGVEIWSACSSYVAPDPNEILTPSPQVGKNVYHFINDNMRYVYVIPHTTDSGDTYYDLRLQGTSMATPFVTLCYALLCSDPTKTTKDTQADATGLGVEWDASVDTAKPYYYLNPQHKALLLNATDFYLATDAGPSDVYFGYGGVNIKAFAQSEVTQQPSKTEEEVISPSLPAYEPTYENEQEIENWASVFWVLCGMISVMTLFSFLRNWFTYRRRQKNESE